jgi:WD40 repeat protein
VNTSPLQVHRVAFSADRKRLAAPVGGRIKVWDIATGRVEEAANDQTWAWLGRAVRSADGKRQAFMGRDERGHPEGTLKVQDAVTGRELFRHKINVAIFAGGEMITFSPNGRYVAAAGNIAGHNGNIMIGDVEADRLLCTFLAPGDLQSMAFSPDGMRLVTTRRANHWTQPSEMKLWDVRTGQELLTFTAPNYPTTNAGFSPDGRLLAAGCWDGSIKLWDSEPAPELFTIRAENPSVARLAFAGPDGGMLAGAARNKFRLWDVKTAEERAAYAGPEQPRLFTPDGRTLIGSNGAGQIELHDVLTGRVLSAPSGRMGLSAWAASADSKTFAVVGAEMPNIPRGGITPPMGPGGRPVIPGRPIFPPPGPPGPRPEPGLVRFWDATTGKELPPLPRRIGPVQCLALSPDGKRIAAPDWRDLKTVKLWDVATGEECAAIKGHPYAVAALAFSPDGKLLAAVAGAAYPSPGEVVLWEMEKTPGNAPARRHATLKGHPGWMHTVVFAPTGPVMATAGLIGVRLWNADTGEQLRAFEGEAFHLAFSPDGKTLATTSSIGIKVWDISSTQTR